MPIAVAAAVAIGSAVVVNKIVQGQAAAAQKKAQEKAEKKAKEQSQTLAGESAALTTEQMKLQVGQRKIAILEEVLLNTPASPRILTLPSNQPALTWVDKINLQIDSFIKG